MPSALAAMTFDAFMIAVEGFKKATTLRAFDVRKGILRVSEGAGLLGPIRMTNEGYAEKPGVIVITGQPTSAVIQG